MPELQLQFLVGAVAVLGLGYLLLKFGQAIAKFLLALGGLIVAGIIGLALLEQARATRAVATTSSSLSAIVILILILLLASGVAAYFYLRRRQRSRAAWIPGPYAYWGQVGQMPGAGLPTQPAAPYPPVLPAHYPPVPPAQPATSQPVLPTHYPPVPPAPVVYPLYWAYPPYPYPYPAMPEEDEDEMAALPWW